MTLAKAKVGGFVKTSPYTGKPYRQDCVLTIQAEDGERTLKEGTDYTVSYKNNVQAGTATVIYYGKNGYTGRLKKTWRITGYDLSRDTEHGIRYDDGLSSCYAKGGSKPVPKILFNGKQLKKDQDFTLRYENNKKVTDAADAAILVKGKGNFSGTIRIPFKVTPQALSDMTLVSADRIYKAKPGVCKFTPKLVDPDGKTLSAGKDFDSSNIVCIYAADTDLENGGVRKAGDSVEEADIIPAGTEIRIRIPAGSSGNYTGVFEGSFHIAKASIQNAKVTVSAQIYTGKEIVPDQSSIQVKVKNVMLTGDDYRIVRCTNNVKKGKASMTIQGVGNYGGTKTVSFKIKSRNFIWWK